MTFREFLEAKASGDDSIGDFARDALRDPQAPGDSSLEWEPHMLHAPDEVRAAFHEAWQAYVRALVTQRERPQLSL